MIQITPGLSIPREELEFRVSRSSGPGGQHVNKVSSRVALRFDVIASRSLSEPQRRRILSALASRISKEGVLQLVSQSRRSQRANREELVERFTRLLRGALARKKVRKKTALPAAARQRRLEEKRHRSRLKRERSDGSFRKSRSEW